MGTSKGGYDAFYTLKPKNWKDDLIRMYSKILKARELAHHNELKIYEDKINIFMKFEDKINKLLF